MVTRAQVIVNGLKCRCPNCGSRTLFKPGKLFDVNESCSVCGLKFEKGEGTFLGPFVLNYAVTAFGVVIPILILYAFGKVGGTATLVLCAVGALGVPLLLYYFFLPDNLPANLEGRAEDDA
jgi:hypothetical protein